ncbi:EAL domain-containing protein (putative c-di-GMP-specific phosphodiesterase class I) [Natronospira proteinivora]|uniref:EAL domain-containing protein (Putative c-di-GMP-specific phosphodiesterase class I) n=1 Tax=Natronospira proteinivora TaxID=1807133 RepID=A0ABT1GA91_9GAMM|nr:EAL domain-containing protein [Natronospira proteinivora]MCP1727825.1 EAL domain-containing protein (putative c-di-GMP-specific phosphodiesterase class I) [Natronospira proteinivora]
MPDQLPREQFAAGEQIFAQGDLGDKAYFIDRGSVDISAEQGGRRVVIARLKAGDLFGELALINQQTRSATAVAVEPTEVVAITAAQLDRALKGANPLLRKLLQVNLGRFQWTQQFMLQNTESGDAGQPLEKRAKRDLALEKEIETAIGERQFEMHYQPIIALRGGNTVGFEALMRWRHPRRGLLYPAEFIEVAERTGQIVEMGRFALEESLNALKAFQMLSSGAGASPRPPLTALAEAAPEPRPRSRDPLFMSINVSGRQLFELQEIDTIGDLVMASGVDPKQVKLEITESLLVDDPGHAAAALQMLREYGMKIALDDFGTGYSSLSYLHQFPMDTLKIDQTFVSTMGRDPKSYRIVRAIVGLAQELGMETIAEGIERNNQLAGLREIECDYGQGYLMSRPASFREARKLLQSRQARW